MMNVVNGGAHADNVLDFQEFMIVPAGFDTFSDAMRAGCEIYHSLKGLLKEKGMVTAVGDEGGFAPDAGGPKAVLGLLVEAIASAGYRAGEQVWLAMDVAASEFYKDGKYELVGEGRSLNSAEMVDYYEELVNEFPLFSIEDGMDEDDFEGWKLMQERIGGKVQIVGDDLFVTNMKRLQMGFDGALANSILIKLNQIGSVKETLEVISAAKEHGYTCVVSHRSGETEDSFIADLAVGIESGQIKTGAPCRSDRVAKYNQLLRLERVLGDDARYAGLEVIKNK
jgi:enolase